MNVTTKDMASNVQVSVRVRPESLRETEDPRHRCILRVCDNMVFVSAKVTSAGAPGIVQRYQDKHFAFDRVYGDNTTTKEVFEGSVKDFVPGLLKGFSLTVFAYGATGSGKTYTMMGTDRSQAGINILTMSHLFHLIEGSKDLEVQVSVSYLEIYNETIRDLLVPDGRTLNLREDPSQGAVVSGLMWRSVLNAESVIKVLEEGRERRVQATTLANEASSRSHAVLQVQVKSQEKETDIHAKVREARLSLVDLAGSERAAMCENKGLLLKEGANINRSLLALGNCINALAARKKAQHVPYRDSKLTRMLKNCLGGSCQAVMIANVSPSSMFYEDTDNTLRYANRAKNIKVTAASRVTTVTLHVSEYRRVIAALQKEVAELRSQLEHTSPRVKEKKVDNAAGEATATPQLAAELAAVMEREVALRKEMVTLHKKKQENVVAMRRQFLTLFRWKHGMQRTAEDGDEAPASIVHARTVADLCGQAEAQLSAQLAALQQQLATAAEQFRFLVNRIPEIPVVHRTLLEVKVQLHERHMKYFEQVLQCAEARAAQQLQAQAHDEAQMALSEVRQHVEDLFQSLSDSGAVNEELRSRHEKARSWLNLPTADLQTELAGDQGDLLEHPLARALVYMNALQHPARRLSATSICSTVRGPCGARFTSPQRLPPGQGPRSRPGPLPRGPSAGHRRPPHSAAAPKAPPLSGAEAETAGRLKPHALSAKQLAERHRQRLHQLQNKPMLTGVCDEPRHFPAIPLEPPARPPARSSSARHPPPPANLPAGSPAPSPRSTSTWAVPAALPKRRASVACGGKRKREDDDGLASPSRHRSCPTPPIKLAAMCLPPRGSSVSESASRVTTTTDCDSTSTMEGRPEAKKAARLTPGLRRRWVRRLSSRSRRLSRLQSNEFDGAELPNRSRLAEATSKATSPRGKGGPSASDAERAGKPALKRPVLRPLKAVLGDPKGLLPRRAPLRQRCPNIIQKGLPYPLPGKRVKLPVVVEMLPQYMQATLCSGQKARCTVDVDSPGRGAPPNPQPSGEALGEPMAVIRRASRKKLQAARDMRRLQRQAASGLLHSPSALPPPTTAPVFHV